MPSYRSHSWLQSRLDRSLSWLQGRRGMHFYTVAFIGALLAFGGIAAYLGDVLGYRLGRKRLTLLNLRPRNTATLIGVLAGILIPAVTVLVGYWQVEEVRIALFHINDLRTERDQLTLERDSMKEQRDRLLGSQQEALAAAERADARAEDRRRRLERAEKALGRANRHVVAAQAGLGRLRSEAKGLRGGLRAVAEDLRKANGELKAAGEDLRKIGRERDQLDDEVATLHKESQRLTEQLIDLQEELERKLAQLAEASEVAYDIFARAKPVFDLNSELVRGVIKRPATVDALKNEVVALYVLADEAAKAGGAAKGGNDRYVLAVRPLPKGEEEGEDQTVPESRVLGEVVRQLWEQAGESFVVQVVAARRTFLLQQVQVGFYAVPNKLCFRKGETIVKREMPPGVDEAEVFDQLWRLIADPRYSEVRKQAQAAGMLPEPATERFGAVEITELFRAAKECAGRDQLMTVRVEAAEDAYTQGPLSINVVTGPGG